MKKIKHKKLFAVSLIACAAVATAGIGYATWVISTDASQNLSPISVTADEVQDNRITLGKPSLVPENGKLHFGPTSDSEGAITSADNNEDMDFAFTFTATAAETVNGTITMTPTWPRWNSTYIVTPCASDTAVTIATITDGVVTAHADTTSGSAKISTSVSESTLTVTVTMAWGSFFGNHNPVNPETYIDGTEVTLDKAVEALNTVAGYNNQEISIVIKASAAKSGD